MRWRAGAARGRGSSRVRGGRVCRGNQPHGPECRGPWLHSGPGRRRAHLALRGTTDSPHGRDHRQRSCRLRGTLLPRQRLVREGTITARTGRQGGLGPEATGAEETLPEAGSGGPTAAATHLCGAEGGAGFMGFMGFMGLGAARRVAGSSSHWRWCGTPLSWRLGHEGRTAVGMLLGTLGAGLGVQGQGPGAKESIPRPDTKSTASRRKMETSAL